MSGKDGTSKKSKKPNGKDNSPWPDHVAKTHKIADPKPTPRRAAKSMSAAKRAGEQRKDWI